MRNLEGRNLYELLALPSVLNNLKTTSLKNNMKNTKRWVTETPGFGISQVQTASKPNDQKFGRD